ncbi:hypothetical protein PCASD_15135, partial [Puccinia coronata f. sp. avenae]
MALFYLFFFALGVKFTVVAPPPGGGYYHFPKGNFGYDVTEVIPSASRGDDKQRLGDHVELLEFTHYRTNPVVPVRTDEEAVPFSEGQQSKRVRIEPSMPEAMGNQGPDYKSIPSTLQSNAGQWIPSTVHSNAGQWNHAHFPVVDNPYFNPEETSHYLSRHTKIPGFYSTPIIPEHSWPAGVYNDPGDTNWIDTLLNSLQELVGKDVFHEQTDNSQQLNEKFANQFLHLHQLDRDDETDNHFANFDNQPLMPNAYFHRTDPNQDLDFVASLN